MTTLSFRLMSLFVILFALAMMISCTGGSECGIKDCSTTLSDDTSGDEDSTEVEEIELEIVPVDVDDSIELEVSAETGAVLPVKGCTLTIPPGALDEDTVIGIDIDQEAVDGFRTAIYKFTPHGLTFSVPATVNIEYDDDLGESISFYWSPNGDPDSYETLAAAFNEGSAVADIEHFSFGYVGISTPADGDEDSDLAPGDVDLEDTELEQSEEMETEIEEELIEGESDFDSVSGDEEALSEETEEEA